MGMETWSARHPRSGPWKVEVLREAVPGLTYDCEKGYCGACETRVLAGTPEHRDSLLTADERAAGRSMMICVGRCSSDRLVLDL